MPKRLRKGISYEEIHEITKIDIWFVDKLAILVEMEKALREEGADGRSAARGKAHRVPG